MGNIDDLFDEAIGKNRGVQEPPSPGLLDDLFDEAIRTGGEESSDVTRGFKTTFLQVPQLLRGVEAGIGAVGEKLFGEGGGFTNIKNAGVRGYLEWSEKLKEDSRLSDSLNYSWERATKDGDYGALVDWLQYGVGYTLGQGAQMLATAGAGSAIGKAVLGQGVKGLAKGLVEKEISKIGAAEIAKETGERLTADAISKLAVSNVASKLGQTAAVGAAAFGMEGGEIFGGLTSEAEREGRALSGTDIAKALGATALAGGFEFVGDKFGLDIMLGKSKVFNAAKDMTGLGGRVARGALGAGAAAPVEAGTEFAQTLTEKYGQGHDPFTKESLLEAVDAAGLGAIGGNVMGFGGGMLTSPQVAQTGDRGAASAAEREQAMRIVLGQYEDTLRQQADALDNKEDLTVDDVFQAHDLRTVADNIANTMMNPSEELQGIISRLSELDRVTQGTPDQFIDVGGFSRKLPGQQPRLFTPEEKAEYDSLKARAVEIGMAGVQPAQTESIDQSIQESVAQAEAQGPVDLTPEVDTTGEVLAQEEGTQPIDTADEALPKGEQTDPLVDWWNRFEANRRNTPSTEQISELATQSDLTPAQLEAELAAEEREPSQRQFNADQIAQAVSGRQRAEAESQLERDLGPAPRSSGRVAKLPPLRARNMSDIGNRGRLSVDQGVDTYETGDAEKTSRMDRAHAMWVAAQQQISRLKENGKYLDQSGSLTRYGQHWEGVRSRAQEIYNAERDSNEVPLTPGGSRAGAGVSSSATGTRPTTTVVDSPASVVQGQEFTAAPTEGQKNSGNYRKAHVKLDGLDIAIENPIGSERSGVDADGTAWSQTMRADYGYVKRSEAGDGDNVDVFIKPGYKGGGDKVHLVRQVDGNGEFDEFKAVVGAESSQDALDVYNSNYEEGWDRGEEVTEMSLDEFRSWVKSDQPKRGTVSAAQPTAEDRIAAPTPAVSEAETAGVSDSEPSPVYSQVDAQRNMDDQVEAEIAQNNAPAPNIRYSVHKAESIMDKRKAHAKRLLKEMGLKPKQIQAEIDRYVSEWEYHDSLMAFVMDKGIANLFPEGIAGLDDSPLRSNQDYTKSLDFSSECTRRHNFNATMIALTKRLGRPMTVNEYIYSAQRFYQNNELAPCLYCYVESMRGQASAQLIKALKQNKASFVERKGHTTVDVNFFYDAELRTNVINKTTDEYAQHDYWGKKDLYDTLWKGYNSVNVNIPKVYSEYNGQILSMSKKFIEKMNRTHGLRMLSTSDFQIEHAVDFAQAVKDMEIVGIAAHLYTKEETTVRFLGNTGIKINLSTTFKWVGDRWHDLGSIIGGMDMSLAKQLRSEDKSGNIGLVAVLGDDRSITRALDEGIDYIIPYHASGQNKKAFESYGFQDYTAQQNEQWLNPGATAKANAKLLSGEIRDSGVVTTGELDSWVIDQMNRILKEGGRKTRVKLADAKTRSQYENKKKKGDNKPPAKISSYEYFDPKKGIDAKTAKINYIELCAQRGIRPVFWKWINHDNYIALKKDYARIDTPLLPVRSAGLDNKYIEEKLQQWVDGGAEVGGRVIDKMLDVLQPEIESGMAEFEGDSVARTTTVTPGKPASLQDMRKSQHTARQGERQEVERLADALLNSEHGKKVARLIISGRLKLAYSPSEAPGGAKSMDGYESEGAYVPNTDTMYLFSSGIRPGEEIKVLLHEGFHRAVERGDVREELAELERMENRFTAGDNALSRWFADARASAQVDRGKPHYIEEIGAYAVSNYATAPKPIQNWVDKLLAKIKTLLGELIGLKVKQELTPEMLAEIAVRGLSGGVAQQGSGPVRMMVSGNKLPIRDGEKPGISGSNNETLAAFLAPVGALEMRLGKERLLRTKDGLDYVAGEYGSWRILAKDKNGNYSGVVQGVTKDGMSVLSNIYVTPSERRKGVASKLIAAAKKAKRNLSLDSHLTEEGAALFGYVDRGPRLSQRPYHSVLEVVASNKFAEQRLDLGQQFAEVEARYRGTDQWMKAPNGKPTKLNERQWVQVRTPAFKEWFGDWERHANSTNAEGDLWADDTVSKVVDPETREPLVVFHGTETGGFTTFDGGTKVPGAFFFAKDRDVARSYSGRGDSIDEFGGNSAVRGIYEVFLDIKNPNEEHFEGANWDGSRDGQWEVYDEETDEKIYDNDGNSYFDSYDDAAAVASQYGGEPREAYDAGMTTNSVVREGKKYGHDGTIIRGVMDSGPQMDAYDLTDVFVTYHPERIKSATVNTGKFSSDNADIRYQRRKKGEDIIDIHKKVPDNEAGRSYVYPSMEDMSDGTARDTIAGVLGTRLTGIRSESAGRMVRPLVPSSIARTQSAGFARRAGFADVGFYKRESGLVTASSYVVTTSRDGSKKIWIDVDSGAAPEAIIAHAAFNSFSGAEQFKNFINMLQGNVPEKLMKAYQQRIFNDPAYKPALAQSGIVSAWDVPASAVYRVLANDLFGNLLTTDQAWARAGIMGTQAEQHATNIGNSRPSGFLNRELRYEIKNITNLDRIANLAADLAAAGFGEVRRSVRIIKPETKQALGNILEDAYTYFVDKNFPKARLQKELGQQPAASDYLAKEESRGKRVAEMTKRYFEDRIQPILQHLAKHDLKISDMEELAYAMHAPEANERLRRVNALDRLRKLQSTMTAQDAQDVKDRIHDIDSTITDPKQMQEEYVMLLEDLASEMPAREQRMLATPSANTVAMIMGQKRILNDWQASKDRLSGITNQEANAIKARWASDPRYRANQLAVNGMAKINKDKMDILYAAGELTDDQYRAMTLAYKHYVPLYREDQDTGKAPVGKQTGPLGKPIKVRGGSIKEVTNIFAHTVDNFYSAVSRAYKLDAAKALYNLVVTNPGSGMAISDVPKQKMIDEWGNIQEYPDIQEHDDQLYIKVDGEKKLITVDRDSRSQMQFIESIKNPTTPIGPIMKYLYRFNRLLAALNTSLSPEFLFSNFSRDFQTAMLNMTDGEAKGLQARVAKRVFPMMRQIYRDERGKQRSALYRDFAAHGGKIGWMQSYDSVEKLSKDLEAEMKLYQPGHNVLKAWRKAGELISSANTAVENSLRLSLYAELTGPNGPAGMTKEKASRICSDLTVDFTKSGKGGPAANALYMFFNASVQGNANIIKRLARSPKLRAAAGGIVGAGFATAMLGIGLGGEDDDGEPRYLKLKRLNPDLFERNMVFMSPDGTIYKVPMPYLYNVFFVLGHELATAYDGVTNDRNYNVADSLARVGSAFANSANPIQAATFFQTIAPTALDPFVQVAENKGWHGGLLMPEQPQYGQPKPDSERYFKSVNPAAKFVAQAMNRITGGNKVEPGLVDISPETIEMFVETATGSAGRFAKDFLSLPYTLTRDEISTSKIPIVRRFTAEMPENADVNIFYQNREEIEQFAELIKAYPDRIGELSKDPRYSMIMYTKKMDQAIKKLNKSLRNTEAAGYTDEQKQPIVDQIRNMALQYNKRYNEVIH